MGEFQSSASRSIYLLIKCLPKIGKLNWALPQMTWHHSQACPGLPHHHQWCLWLWPLVMAFFWALFVEPVYQHSPWIEVFTLPGWFHMDSIWTGWISTPSPWISYGLFFGWVPSHFFSPYPLWNPYGLSMEYTIPYGFYGPVHMDSIWIS